MSRRSKWVGASMAAAVAAVFIATPSLSASADNHSIVVCPGVNACQGRSDCRVTTMTCKVISERGQNACKGQGILRISKIECVKRGGHGIEYSVPSNAVNSLPLPGSEPAAPEANESDMTPMPESPIIE